MVGMHICSVALTQRIPISCLAQAVTILLAEWADSFKCVAEVFQRVQRQDRDWMEMHEIRAVIQPREDGHGRWIIDLPVRGAS